MTTTESDTATDVTQVADGDAPTQTITGYISVRSGGSARRSRASIGFPDHQQGHIANIAAPPGGIATVAGSSGLHLASVGGPDET